MITLLHPGFLYAALAVAMGIVALHFIITEQPRTGVLPTVRFFPDVRARATTLTLRMSDVLLLVLRVLTVLLVGLAFSQPRFNPAHRAVAKIVAIDISRNTRTLYEAKDSARAYLNDAAAVVLFDSTAREVPPQSALDSLTKLPASSNGRRTRGMLSPALIASLRAAARVREHVDSLEIVVVSPLTAEERDAGTMAIRSLWPGHVRVVRVSAAVLDTSRGRGASRLSLVWADSSAGSIWEKRAKPDTVGAVSAGQIVLVYPFVRRWKLARADTSEHVIARWIDGEPAAVERGDASGCARSVAVSMPTIGDAMLRPEFMRFREALSNPCGNVADLTPLPADYVRALEGRGSLAAASAIQPRVTRMTPPVPWLLAAALVLALLELLVRRQRRPASTAGSAGSAGSAGAEASRTPPEPVGKVA